MTRNVPLNDNYFTSLYIEHYTFMEWALSHSEAACPWL